MVGIPYHRMAYEDRMQPVVQDTESYLGSAHHVDFMKIHSLFGIALRSDFHLSRIIARA